MAAKNQCLKRPKRKKPISLIRPMTMQDVPVLIAIGARMHQESTYSNLDYSPKKETDVGNIMNQPGMSGSALSKAVPSFDPEGVGYDYATAKSFNMGPTGDGTEENKGHWGSVAPASNNAKKKYNLPDESYLVLKGKSHETFSKAVAGEEARGFVVKKFGDRYYSIPK